MGRSRTIFYVEVILDDESLRRLVGWLRRADHLQPTSFPSAELSSQNRTE